MDLPPELLPVAAGFLLAGVVQGALGFGFGLVSVTCAALVLDLPQVVPVVSSVAVVVYSVTALVLRASFVPRDLAPLALGIVFGVPVGVVLLKNVPSSWLLAGLGVVLLAGTANQLRQSGPPPELGPAWGTGAGLMAGVLAGSVGFGGPPAILYVASQPWSKERTTALLQVLFVSTTALQLVGYGVAGLLQSDRVRLAVWCAPAAAVGLALGMAVFRKLPEAGFRRLVQASLAVLGAWFLLKAFL